MDRMETAARAGPDHKMFSRLEVCSLVTDTSTVNTPSVMSHLISDVMSSVLSPHWNIYTHKGSAGFPLI